MKHLNSSDQRALAQRLAQMRDEALHELRGEAPAAASGEAAPASDVHEVHTNADQAEALRMDEVRYAEIEIDRTRLQDIERAQQRMDEGRYGTCMDCGENIPVERLLTLPTAIRCARCQTLAEGGAKGRA